MPALICHPQQPQETRPEYASRVLRFALQHDLGVLDVQQLETADKAAQATVAAFPMKLDPTTARVDDRLHDLRIRIARRLTAHRARLAWIQRECTRLDTEPTQGPDAPQGQPGAPDAPPETETDRAVRLLKAALILIMTPGNGNGGGTPARLQPPRPTRPPGGIALQAIDEEGTGAFRPPQRGRF